MFSQCQEFELCVQTELITLSKQAYEKILDIQKTPDLQERVNFLKVMIIPHHFKHFHYKCQVCLVYMILFIYLISKLLHLYADFLLHRVFQHFTGCQNKA
jgi:hypothetical protein